MSALPGPFYRFRTREQWGRAATAGVAEAMKVDFDTGTDVGGMTGCHVGPFAFSPSGDLFRVVDGRLFAGGREPPYADTAGPTLGAVERLVAGRRNLWALCVCGKPEDGHRSLTQIDAVTLQIVADADAGNVSDIALDGRGILWLLAGDRLSSMTDRGVQTGNMQSPDVTASALAAAGSQLALLSGDHEHLHLLDPKTGAVRSIDLSRFAGPGWAGETATLSSAGENVLIQGEVDIYAGGTKTAEPRFFLIGPGGDLLIDGSWRDNRAPRLLVAGGNDLFGLAEGKSERRLLRFGATAIGGGERRLTPALETESPAGRWLRAEVKALLPERATLTLRWAASADGSLRRRVQQILSDMTVPVSWQLDRVDALLTGAWSDPLTYVGEHRDGRAVPERFTFPLHEANGPILWVDCELRRNSADLAPQVCSLLVLHEAESLMDNLPAIYSGDGDRDGTMRRLVAVLEATTQGIDCRIGGLARRLDPARTSERWLPDLAAMLGLPFHDALSPKMQRALVKAAPSILAHRGTRRGLLDMLAALFPGRPARVIDRTEQLIPITLGHGGAGGRLPALLSGPSVRVPRLNARLVLTKTALCRTTACADQSIAPPPQVLVTIPATRAERRRYGHAITAMAEAMIPAGVRLRLNWTAWHGGDRPVPDHVITIIEPPELVGLGDGPALGRGRIGGRAGARLDRDGGTPAEHRLL